jgi:phosphatidylserine/phosphatidylglycerophosphate/cardiolipin synthase-like enzyme
LCESQPEANPKLTHRAETISFNRLDAAGAETKRTHFGRQQHNKVFIVRRNGQPVRVLCGSTNFSLRGFYIQANNALLFDDGDVAAKFSEVFDAYSNMVYHKFLVTDCNDEHPTVFTASSNMTQGGEEENGDHLIQIEDRKVAISFAIEALRLFDTFISE